MEHLDDIKKSVWTLYYEDYITFEEFLKIDERIIKKFKEYTNKRLQVKRAYFSN